MWLSELGLCLPGVRRRSRFKHNTKENENKGKNEENKKKNCLEIDLENVFSRRQLQAEKG